MALGPSRPPLPEGTKVSMKSPVVALYLRMAFDKEDVLLT